MVDNVKKRRIFKKDWDNIAEFITTEFKHRKASKWRKRMEPIWKEVDRQVAMEEMQRRNKNPAQQKGDWRSALELGELSRASEILTADINRNIFPVARDWMAPHNNVDWPIDELTGTHAIDPDIQKRIDGRLRSMMAQQHADFGFIDRQTLAIKEALHHGGYVAEARMESLLHSTPEKGIKNVVAPVWVTHSMWHCYPEETAAITASNLFYNGSMIIMGGMRHSKLIRQTGKGWMQSALQDLERPTKDKDKDIITWHGDITIQRKGEDVYLPNVEVKVVDSKVVYYLPNDLPYSRIIYNGYERLDVRDPYFISPLVKMSPTQKFASIMANKFIDGVTLKNEPPVEYDGMDSDLKKMGGPNMSPGSKTPVKGMGKIKTIEVGDPQAALAGLQFGMTELQKGTGVDANRSGLASGTEQTATEVERTHQGGQIRTIDFVGQHERQGLRPFLYLQHDLNKLHLNKFSFYNPVVGFPDFDVMSKSDLNDKVHFDVVGSKGLQEERQREAETMAVTRFLVEVGYEVNMDAVAKDLYQDAGKKDPEEYLKPTNEMELKKALVEMQAQMEQMMAQAQEIAKENESLKTQEISRVKDAEVKQLTEEQKAENDRLQMERKAELEQFEADNKARLEAQKANNDHQLALFKAFVDKATQEPEEENEDQETKAGEMRELLNQFEQTMSEFTRALTADKIPERDAEGFIKRVITEKPTLN